MAAVRGAGGAPHIMTTALYLIISGVLIGMSLATRDSLFLTSLDFSALPNMLIATSVVSILLVAANVRAARSIRPEVLVPASFVASAILFICEWLFRSMAPSVGAVVVYLHISAVGPLLASGFWLISSERFVRVLSS
jgi:hypothetical protein